MRHDSCGLLQWLDVVCNFLQTCAGPHHLVNLVLRDEAMLHSFCDIFSQWRCGSLLRFRFRRSRTLGLCQCRGCGGNLGRPPWLRQNGAEVGRSSPRIPSMSRVERLAEKSCLRIPWRSLKVLVLQPLVQPTLCLSLRECHDETMFEKKHFANSIDQKK